MIQRASMAFACVLLSACAVYDTGGVDYRRVTVSSSPGKAGTAVEGSCRTPCTLENAFKNQALGTPIRPKEVYSISIDHGLIADMVEPKFAARRAVQLRNPFRRVGEIVILASVFEFQAGASSTQGFVDFSDLSDAKVIYYNPDVEAHQHLNFSNIPLLSPREYGGRPVGVQIFIIELDRMSKPMQGLLSQLADLGWASNVLPAGAGAELLTKLGKSMLSGAHDDTIFEYRFVLDPSGTDYLSPVLEAGRYVLIRQQERQNAFNWSSVSLDANSGALLCSSVPGCGTNQPFNAATYLVLNVKRHPAGSVSAISERTYRNLLTAIDKAADDRDAGLSDVAAQVQTITAAATANMVKNKFEQTTSTTLAAVNAYDRALLATQAVPGACPTISPDAGREEIAIRQGAAALYEGLATAEPTVGADRLRSMLAGVGELFLPLPSDVPAAAFIDLSSFRNQFKSGNELGDALVKALKGRVATQDCILLND